MYSASTQNKQKGIAELLVIGVVLLLIVGGGAYYLGTQKNKTTPPGCYWKQVQCVQAPCDPVLTCDGPTSSPNPQPSPTPMTDETANWKTYTNSRYGYSIKYPDTWHFLCNKEEMNCQEDSASFREKEIDGEASGVVVSFLENPKKQMLTEWWQESIEDYPQEYKSLVPKEIKFDGLEALFVSTGENWTSRPFSSTYIAKDEKVWDISTDYTPLDPDQKGYNIYTQMLSTFKFE